MRIKKSTALFTGANRGLGKEFVAQLLERGAKKVYAPARNRPGPNACTGAEVLHLDLFDSDSISRAAAIASDVTLLINSAGAERLRLNAQSSKVITLQSLSAHFTAVVSNDGAQRFRHSWRSC